MLSPISMYSVLRPYTLLVLPFLALVGSCNKHPAGTECPQITQAPQAFLDYWYFPEGSQWVYRLQGSIPTVYDTVRVAYARESHQTNRSPGDPLAACVQAYQVSLTHSNHRYFPGTGKAATDFLATHPLFYQQEWVLTQSNDVRTQYPLEIGFGYPIRIGEKLLSSLLVVDTLPVVTPAGMF